MKNYSHNCRRLLLSLFLASFNSAQADAIWHCSRAAEAQGQHVSQSSNDQFQLASNGLSSEAIGISLVDLMDAYSAQQVQVNGRSVTACFMPGGSALSGDALKSLGLSAAYMQQLSRKSAIVQSKLKLVTDEAQMLSCISKSFPAVGYLSAETKNELVVPCF